jgi:hypothetical protein
MAILEALKREEAALLKHLDTIRKVRDRVIKQQASDGKKPVQPSARCGRFSVREKLH